MRSTVPLFVLAFAMAAPVAAAEVVPVSQFPSIELRGGGTVVVRPGQTQRVTIVNGSTQFTRVRVANDGKLRIDACNERCPRHYNLQIEIVSPRAVDAAISGGGAISFASGFQQQGNLSVAVNGGGQIDARQVPAQNVSAAVNGGGRILTGRSSNLSAAVNGGGEVRYLASSRVNSAIHGGGAVRRAE